MNIGNEISNIRKEGKMTQEEFGRLFHVTRQTVSNWENEKSYPDLQILVDISDMFGISLDKLLKEDKEMVKKMDKDRRLGKIGKYIIGIAAFILIICIGYIITWNVMRNNYEKNFRAGINQYGFTADTGKSNTGKEVKLGSFSTVMDHITYTVYKEDFPGLLKFDLNPPKLSRVVVAECGRDGNTIHLRMDAYGTSLMLLGDMTEKDHVFTQDVSAAYPLDDTGRLKGKEKNIEYDVKSAYDDMQEEIQTAVIKMKEMYQTFTTNSDA